MRYLLLALLVFTGCQSVASDGSGEATKVTASDQIWHSQQGTTHRLVVNKDGSREWIKS